MEEAKSIGARFNIAFEGFGLAIMDLLPVLVFCLIFPMLFVRTLGLRKNLTTIVSYEVTFFSGLGLLVAYLNYLTSGTVLANLLPSLVVAITFLFQLLGRAKITSGVPLRTRSTLLSGIATVVSFLICSRYFTLLFNART